MKDVAAMSYGWLKDPISDEAPCGPNLEAANDPDFLDYYFDAEARLPERYFTPGLKNDRGEGTDDKLFDPKSVNHKKERTAIDGFLKRSRDLRLLVLAARFQILAGRLSDFADALDGIAELLEAWPDAVHPQMGKSASDRRLTLDDLGKPVTVTIPLQYVALTGSVEVSYRRYMVASGQSEARAGEGGQTPTQILDGLGDAAHAQAVTRSHADLSRAAEALDRIMRACLTHPEKPFTPALGDVRRVITDIQELIHQARPDLPVWTEGGGASAEPAAKPSEEGIATIARPAAGPAATDGGATVNIAGHAAARMSLQTVERYLAAREPSSAAILLVTQARLLIGKPLIEALETLLPEHSKKAVIDFGPGTGFALSIDRLRSLSAETAQKPADTGDLQAPTPAAPNIRNRQDVAAQIRGVEDFFRRNEPTSPIPILLIRARAYLDKDFEAIVAELIPIPGKDKG